MTFPSTKDIVDAIVRDYRMTALALSRAGSHQGDWASDSPEVYIHDADAIQEAYEAGRFRNISFDEVDTLRERYAATDIYDLVATYFRKRGRILNIKM